MKRLIILAIIAFIVYSIFISPKYATITVLNRTGQEILHVGYSPTGTSGAPVYKTLSSPLADNKTVDVKVPLNTECQIVFRDSKDYQYFSPPIRYSEEAVHWFEMERKHRKGKYKPK